MKKITAFFCLVCLICACEKSKVTEIENNVITEEEAFDLVLQSINELNASYGYDETKSMSKPFVVAASDAAGGAIGRWVGKTLGAGAGVVTGNPVVGVVGYVGGRKFGGWAGSVMASALAEKYYPTDAMAVNNPFVLKSLPYTATGYYPAEDISFGDIHNYFLPMFRNTETSFLTPEGTVNSEDLFNDLQALAVEYNVEDPLLSNESWKETMTSYYDELAVVLNNASSNNEDPEVTITNIQQVMENIGMPEEEAQAITPVISSLSSCVATLRPNRVKSYERDYTALISASKMRYEKKLEFIDLGSVTIMSTAYWNTKK